MENNAGGFTVVTNKKAFVTMRWLALAFALLIAVDVVFSALPGSLADIAKGHYLAYVGGLGLAILSVLPVYYFHYDDSYEILHLRSKSLWTIGTGVNKRYDFPKRKVTDFQVKGKGLFRTLLLTLDNYASDSRKVRKLNISFISESQHDQLIQSLERIKAKNLADSRPK